MKKIKYTAVILFVSLLTTGTIDAQKYFKVIDATSTSWSGGVAQSGTGITYNVKIVLLTKQKVTFNEMWVNKGYGPTETRSVSYSDGRALTKGDTVIVTYTVHHYPEGSPMEKIPAPAYKDPPIPIQGEALISFTIGKSKRYRSVEKFTPLATKKYM